MTITFIPEQLGQIINDPYKQKSFSKREADLTCTCGEINGTYTVTHANIKARQHDQEHSDHTILIKEITCGGLSF